MFFEILINSIQESIILLDKKAVITFINKSGEELLGRSSREIAGKGFNKLFPEERNIPRLFRKVISEGRSLSTEDVDINLGRLIRADFNMSPFFIDGKNEGVLLSIKEGTAISEKEDYPFDSLIYLLASIAHEIKNPLAGIKGAAQLLRDKVRDDGSLEYISLIVKETDRLNKVLQDYLTICKNPVLHYVNIYETVEKAIELANIPSKNGTIKIRKIYDPSLPDVLGDEGKLLQVFLNMIKNALDAMPKGGVLEIVTKPSDEYVIKEGKIRRLAAISIRDTGHGISHSEIQKIFLPFYTKKKKGTGLGLALSKKIIKDHNGFIRVESSKDKGTTFHIYLPFEEKWIKKS